MNNREKLTFQELNPHQFEKARPSACDIIPAFRAQFLARFLNN